MGAEGEGFEPPKACALVVGSTGFSFALAFLSTSLRSRNTDSTRSSSASGCRSLLDTTSVAATPFATVRSPGHEMPAAVDGQVDAVDRSIREQEQGGVEDVRHCRQPTRWRLRSMSLEHGGRLRAPVRTVADDPWMDRIDPYRRQLHDQRPDQ